IHNTLSSQLEEFRPMVEGEVKFYYCGPTVWDFGHIGNFRSAIAADLIRRYLKLKGLRVMSVMNLTDVDDRIIAKAAEAGQSLDEYTAKYIEAFWEDFDALGCERPDVAPRATRHIPEMVALVEKLEQNNHAYRSDHSIYYRINSFPNYGKLSKINFAGNIAGGSQRVDTDKYEKEDARDFALWKAPTNQEELAWQTAIGRGRPGWHIECSAMSMKYLGDTFDLHLGGIDLVFPHHENEIAQSEGATGKQFARYWFHFEHLKVEGETMSKSKGNYYTYRDLIEKGFTAPAIRYFLLSVPPRKQLNFTFDALGGAEKTVASLRDFRARVEETKTEAGRNEELSSATRQALKDFEAGMDDDLNTSVALAAVHDLTREVNTALAKGALPADDQREVLEAIEHFDSVLNVFGDGQPHDLDLESRGLIALRQEARHRRDFKRADEIRDELLERGIILEDTKDGFRWKRK
ncbi:MAG TPA: cysteine--tRNA ligase, partial [Pyrinomonadaceae bacterium]|nr:cysteine--tRNA ligase [Pyrinomonadaceae bacterium]